MRRAFRRGAHQQSDRILACNVDRLVVFSSTYKYRSWPSLGALDHYETLVGTTVSYYSQRCDSLLHALEICALIISRHIEGPWSTALQRGKAGRFFELTSYVGRRKCEDTGENRAGRKPGE